MTAPVLTVDRLTATLHAERDTSEPDRVAHLLASVARDELDSALTRHQLPPGHWCLDRLDLRLDLDLGQHDTSLARSWADALAGAVAEAVRAPGAVAVHYAHELDALADVVSGLACDHRENHWAWCQVGVVRADDPALGRAAALAALGRHPVHALAAVVRALRRCGLPALHRLLGPTGWVVLASLVWSAASGGRADGAPPEGGPGTDARSSRHRTAARRAIAASELGAAMTRTHLRPADGTVAAWAVLVAVHTDPSLPHRTAAPALLRAVRDELTGALLPAAPRPARSVLLGAAEDVAGPTAAAPLSWHRRGDRIDPDTVTTRPAGESHVPGSGTSGAPQAAGRSARRTPVPPGGNTPHDAPRDDGSAAAPAAWEGGRAARSPAGAAPAATPASITHPRDGAGTTDPAGPAPDPSDGDGPGAPTDWAGLPFLLATAAAAGLPGIAVEDPDLATRPLPWVLHAVGRAVADPVPDDPGLLALAGLDSSRAAVVLRAPEATEREVGAVERIAGRWLEVTAARLAVGDGPGDGGPLTLPDATEAARQLVLPVLRRPGVVRAEPGWIEVHLPLAGVDPVVRRAGLDLDPGWVPWLGAVVRYVYV